MSLAELMLDALQPAKREADIKVPADQGEGRQVLGWHLQEDEGRETRPNVQIETVEAAVQKQNEHSKKIIEQNNKPVEDIEDEKGNCQNGC